MGRVQSSLILFCLGLFLLSVGVFRHEWFYSADGLPYLLIGLLGVGFILIAMGLFRLLTGKGWHGIVVLVVLEVLLIGAFKVISTYRTSRIPDGLKQYLTEVYISGFMNCIQYDRTASQFDGSLQYILKPGSHAFTNWEFNTRVDVNRKGLRDSEQNLQSPEVIFLGDSYTMGWGVEEKNSFVRQFANATGKRCLNAGISSYGTAREYLMLNRMSLDSCKLLVIQYHENDLLENYMFFHNGERLASEKEFLDSYRKSLRINFLVKNYYPFKYLYWLARNSIQHLRFTETVLKKSENENQSEAFPTNHAPYVTKVLTAVREHYKGPILFFCLGKPIFPDVNGQLAGVVKDNKALGITWLDMRKAQFEEQDFFIFDMHLNEKGHRKVADQLIAFLHGSPLLTKNDRRSLEVGKNSFNKF